MTWPARHSHGDLIGSENRRACHRRPGTGNAVPCTANGMTKPPSLCRQSSRALRRRASPRLQRKHAARGPRTLFPVEGRQDEDGHVAGGLLLGLTVGDQPVEWAGRRVPLAEALPSPGAAGTALSSPSSAAKMPARVPKCRNAVPLPSPARVASPSMVTFAGALLGEYLAGGLQQVKAVAR